MSCDEIEVDEDMTAYLDGWEMNAYDSVAICKCGREVEPDCPKCGTCRSRNPFVLCGVI